jgi:hypothetical protein
MVIPLGNPPFRGKRTIGGGVGMDLGGGGGLSIFGRGGGGRIGG